MLVESPEYNRSSSMDTSVAQIANLSVNYSIPHADAQSWNPEDSFALFGIEMSPFALLLVQRILGSIKAREVFGRCVQALQPDDLHLSFS